MSLLLEFSEEELRMTDVNLFNLEKKPWEFIRGAKTVKEFSDFETQFVCIKIKYNYREEDNGRSLIPENKTYTFFNEDGSTGLEYEIPLTYSNKKLKAVQREMRQGRIDYLETAAENLHTLADALPEPHKTQYDLVANSIELLFSHYESEISHYIQRGTSEFENAVNNEQDINIKNILNIPARQPDSSFPNGLTVRQSILYQLTGVKF